MTPNLIRYFRDEYFKRLHSGLAWTREANTDGQYHHIQFNAKKYLSRFSEKDAQEISSGIQPPKYKQDKRFSKLRRLLDGMTPDEIMRLINKYQ